MDRAITVEIRSHVSRLNTNPKSRLSNLNPISQSSAPVLIFLILRELPNIRISNNKNSNFIC